MITEIGTIKTSSGGLLLKMWLSKVECFHRPLLVHYHIPFEISLVAEGSGTYTIENKEYTMRKGDFFIFTSNEPHYITECTQDGLELLNLHFEPRYLFGSSKDSLSNANINTCFSHNPSFPHRICANDTGCLSGILMQIRQELEHPQPEMSLMVKSLVNMFMIHLIRDFNFADLGASTGKSHIHSIRLVFEYIEQNYTANLTLNEIAKVAGMSPNYLSSVFNKIVGISLWDYIEAKRIEKATFLLIHNQKEETILTIALQSGFNNTSNFNKIFRKHTGMTPSEYRNQSTDFLFL